MTISGTQKPTPPTIFNLQASDWVHCEEETGVYYQLSRLTYKFVIFNFFKVAYFAQKNMYFSKNSLIYIFFFFQKEIIGHMYIRTKCKDNFKFTISLKS